MKTKLAFLILITFLINTCLSAQSKRLDQVIHEKEDKINHFTCGYMIGVTSNCIAYEITKNKTVGFISGIVISSLAGHLKERTDLKYSRKDVMSTICGGACGTITIRLVLWNSVHRKKATMEQRFEVY